MDRQRRQSTIDRETIAPGHPARADQGESSQPMPVRPRGGLRQQFQPYGFDRRGCAALGVLGVLIAVLVLIGSALTLERAVRTILLPPTATLEPTPDITPLGAGPVQAPPSVDVALIRRVLNSYNSPAADQAQAFYDLGVARGIDPAYCLAFFIVESGAGTRGVARTTYSIGNIRALAGQPSFEGYRRYDTWYDGIADWYRLIDEVYVHELNLTTLDAIVPVYAPSHDANEPALYILTVKRLVARWRGL